VCSSDLGAWLHRRWTALGGRTGYVAPP